MHVSNAVKIMIFISDVQYYVPIIYVKLQEASIFQITASLKPEKFIIKSKLHLDTQK